MDKRSKIGLAIICMFLCAFTVKSQSIDEERMERDLKVAENILATLAGNESRPRLFDNVESNYVPDYGVIFSIPQNTYIFARNLSGGVVYTQDAVGSSYTISSGDGDSKVAIVQLSDDAKDEKEEKREKEKEEKEEVIEKMLDEQKEQIATFLVDYADLIGQLKPSERVVVQVRPRSERLFISGRGTSKKPSTLSGQIMKSDLIAYKQGKMDRKKALEKVEFTSEDGTNIPKDVELFATIFARLYEPDLSSTYYVSARNIGYTKLDGFGVTFNMKVYSSSSEGGLHAIRTTGQNGLSQEERDEIVNAMYPDFEQTFKENVLDYGRTIRSLEEKEMLLFKVKLTECRGCEMPGEIEVSVSGKTLQSYDKGALSKENALKQVSVKKK